MSEKILHSFSPQLSTFDTSGATLFLKPRTGAILAGKTAAIDIIVDSKKAPRTVQLEMKYDPLILNNIQITPGDFFLDPEVILNTINTNTGRISYGIKSKTERIRKQTGIVAMLSFIPQFGFQTATAISFLPKTEIRTREGTNILKSISDVEIHIASSSGTP